MMKLEVKVRSIDGDCEDWRAAEQLVQSERSTGESGAVRG
jgi:hypothetical protein